MVVNQPRYCPILIFNRQSGFLNYETAAFYIFSLRSVCRLDVPNRISVKGLVIGSQVEAFWTLSYVNRCLFSCQVYSLRSLEMLWGLQSCHVLVTGRILLTGVHKFLNQVDMAFCGLGIGRVLRWNFYFLNKVLPI